MPRITIVLSEQEQNALYVLAEKEFREPRLQAALMIHQMLEIEGLIETTELSSIVSTQDKTPSKEEEIDAKKI